MLRSIARYGSAVIALGVLSLSISQTGCGNKTKDTALPGTKLGPVISASQPESTKVEPESEPAPETKIDPTFFPGTKAGPMLPKSTPTSQKKKTPNNKNSNEPNVMPGTKSGKFFAPPSKSNAKEPLVLPPSKSGEFFQKK